ncbi:ABC-2 type transporter-domain-containing protein [Dichotomocladium elegans]|nr:ABC-2 type transporter-domain-containing protein [Dichotomocladium elegans]
MEKAEVASLSGSSETVLTTDRNDRTCGYCDTFGEPKANEVSIEAAIEEYEEVRRELSRISRIATQQDGKLEEGQIDEFDLDDFLHGIRVQGEQAGHKPKQLGLIWKDLVVEGLGADAHTIPTVFSNLASLVQPWKYFGFGVGGSRKTILHNLHGFTRPGEMLLVLGRPGAGCTTLLRVLANMRSAYTYVGGDVSYGGIDPSTFAKQYRGQVVYLEEEDQHYPTLTLKQTLEFALRTKTPGNRLPNETRADFVDKILYLLGNMLGLTKQMNTMVGNAFIRGLSGGERKRLSIAEAMTTQSSISIWDCATRGLDAASALDYVRSLRIMTNVFRKTTIATLYQASNSIFHLFDNVLLLDDGYCIYFGPVSCAKNYFEELGFHCPPRKSVPDFLTGICNPLEREIKPGFEATVPLHAPDFQDRYYASDIYKHMMAELQEYENQVSKDNHAEAFAQAVRDEHQKRAPKAEPYTASFYQQVRALTLRQFHLLIKDNQALISRYGSILIQGLILASCFFRNPLTGLGAFSRGGALFFTVIFNTLLSQAELISFLTGRPILEKQKHFAMYRPSAFYIAQVVMDIPYAIVQVLLFEVCSYFMMGLNLDAGRFFAYFIICFFMVMTMNGFFRFFGTFTTSFFVSSQVSSVLMIAAFIYVGYQIPYDSMHPWLYWLYWINPLAYGYKALLINEMHGQIYSCEGPGNAVPYGPGYDNWANKVCTMVGGVPGQNYVLGDDYLREHLSYEPSHLWAPDFVALVGFFLLFTVVNSICMEYLGSTRTGGGSLTKLYLPGKAPRPRTKEEETEYRKRQTKVSGQLEKISTGTTFAWHHINYTVDTKDGPLRLLSDISGIVKPGHLTALMGSSGAGKTTLLDVLSRRKTIGKIDGLVYLNNEALMNDFERITGYCEQMDIHQPAVTVREAMRFSAYLRQDSQVPQAEKDAYVEQIIQLLEMEDIADAQIGEIETGFGISIEERKRLTIAMELVAKPKLLFLDEPTSGLDSQSSFNIIRFIRKLADAGWPVLCTIHQPSSILFEHFDHLLLLVRGGRTAYYGEIGPDARTMIEYFESNGGPACPPDANPAEYLLEVVGAGTAGKATRDWADIWANSRQARDLQEELDAMDATANKHPAREARTYATGFWYQFWAVYKRMTLVYWRSTDYNAGRFTTLMLISLLNGFTFWKLSYSPIDLQGRVFVLFDAFLMANFMIILAQPKFMTERLYFRREYASRFYGWAPFAFSTILVEIPYIIVFAAFFMFGMYWTAGLVPTSEATGYFYIMLLVFVFWSVLLGFNIASIAENPTLAGVVNPVIISILVLFCGLMQPASAMPKFWSSWMYWLNPFHYFVEGLSVNELVDLPAICSDKDFVKFSPPANQTCGQYAADFLSYSQGYIANPDATGLCEYCSFSSGKEYYTSTMGWSESNKWRNLGIVAAFFGFNMIVFLALCYWKRLPRR